MKLLFNLVFAFVLCSVLFGQRNENFTLADTLRGSNTEYRNWWNVTHYTIMVEPDFDKKFIKGSVKIDFELNENYTNQHFLQLDLQSPLNLNKVEICSTLKNTQGKDVNTCNPLDISTFKHIGNAYLINLVQTKFDSQHNYSLQIEYSGKPTIAVNPPWDGGWVFTKDKNGEPWMSVACQGLGASVWYPCKDYQGDEPDNGAVLKIVCPNNLVAVGNGRLKSKEAFGPEKSLYSWEVVNPINNYNIIPYIGKYVNFTDTFSGEKGNLDLNYWVLNYNLEKAENQFQQVKPMLKAFEDWMGPYPFYEDSYKLVEAPYLGMEHQSAIAYGNHYENGYLGRDLSHTGVGEKWDFIIIHESGHEWFGNNITTNDVADMWVQEAFTSYSETLYTQNTIDKESAFMYVRGTKKNIQNDVPIIGKYSVNSEGSSDMYYKGANMIHTLRMVVNNDDLFKNMIRDMNKTFYHQTVTSAQIENYISQYFKMDLTAFFNQYLRTTQIPKLVTKKKKGKTQYKFENIVEGFSIPVKLKNGKWITPNSEWQTTKNEVKIDPNFLIEEN